MRLLLTFTTAFLFAALFSILPRNIIIKESKELNYTFVKVVPCISYSHHLILNMLKGRPKAIENRTKSHTTLLAYLALLVLTNANDIQVQKETTYGEHVIRLWIGKTGESYARLATNGTMLAAKTYTLYLTNSWVTQS